MLKTIMLAAVIVTGFLFGCTDKVDQQDATVAANFALKDMEGKTVKLSDHRGKVVLLEFWTTWCPPCRAAIPGLEKLNKTYKDKGLVILAVSMDDFSDWGLMRSFIKDYGITYTVLQGTDEVAGKYRVRAIPLTLVLDKKGNIAAKPHVGFVPDEDLEKEIKALL